LVHGIDALRQSVTRALVRLSCALFTHVAADARQMLRAGAVVLIAPIDNSPDGG
jgi:hypothetical protein